jgi:hypothetical protein
MRALNNSTVPGFTAKAAELGSDEYTARVASPVMTAVDTMPKAYRERVNEFGYVDVYRAWRKGLTPSAIKASAVDGTFHLS